MCIAVARAIHAPRLVEKSRWVPSHSMPALGSGNIARVAAMSLLPPRRGANPPDPLLSAQHHLFPNVRTMLG